MNNSLLRGKAVEYVLFGKRHIYLYSGKQLTKQNLLLKGLNILPLSLNGKNFNRPIVIYLNNLLDINELGDDVVRQ